MKEILVLLFSVALSALAQTTDVLTCHNDNARTGQNLNETILTPANVNSAQFGLLRVLAADGQVYAQPLYVAGLSIPLLGPRNVVFVATEHDSVYAYDADSGNLFWRVSVLGNGETPSDDRGCGSQITPEIGVTATPVIDRQLGTNGTIFVVAMSKNASGQYFQRLHALDLATGADWLTAAAISATYPGTGDNSSGGNVVFDPAQYKERTGLLLLNGTVYTAWASHCDIRPYSGWIMGYDEHTLAQTSVLNITPNGSEGAIWMSGAGLAADAGGNIYFLAGNGTFDTTLTAGGFPINQDFGNAFMKLSTAGNVLTPVDYFATYNSPAENAADLDLGSGGALVLPDMTDAQGLTRQLVVGAGKDANIFLLDRSNMGKFNPANDNAIYQELTAALPGGVWAMPAYFNGTLYYGSVGHPLKAFPFQTAGLSSSSSQTPGSFGYPGTTPSISANGNANGIVWCVERVSPAVLHAYAASNLANELYNSSQAANNRDHFGAGNKFTPPTIANGKVYAATTTGVGVFGLLAPPDTQAPSVPTNLTATAISSSQVNLSWAASTDNVGVAGYQVFRNGSQIATPGGTAYADTNLAAATTYTYAVAAFDAAGNVSAASASVQATTPAAPPPDTNAPAITLTAPTNGATVAGLVTISANATDNVAVVGVQFKVDGANLGAEVTTLPYQTAWNSATSANGTHTLTATARDAASNSATAIVTVTVSNTVPVQGLVCYWTLDEGTGTTANDSSASGNNGTLVNSPTWTTGKINGALSFNGANNYVSTAAINLSGTRAVTVSLWVNRTYGSANAHTLFESTADFNSSTTGFGFFPDDTSNCSGGGMLVGVRGNAGYNLKCYAQLSSGVWHHLVAVFDKSQTALNEVNLFTDGVLQAAQRRAFSSANTNNFGTNPLYLMSHGGSQEFCAGVIDDFRVYNRALSVAEVQQLYALGTNLNAQAHAVLMGPTAIARIVTYSAQNSHFTFTVMGESGRACAIEASPDLENWSQVKVVVLLDGMALVSEPLGASCRFYRVKLLP